MCLLLACLCAGCLVNQVSQLFVVSPTPLVLLSEQMTMFLSAKARPRRGDPLSPYGRGGLRDRVHTLVVRGSGGRPVGHVDGQAVHRREGRATQEDRRLG